MNKANYIQILKNPNLIQQENTTELKTIIDEFPYFQSARALYLKGLKSNNSFKYNNELKTTAAHTTDRTILFNLITSEVFKETKNTIIKKPVIEEIPQEIPKEVIQLKQELSVGKPLAFSQNETHSFNQWLETGRKTFETVYRSAEDSCVILYTSGTTGAAKGAELSQSNMLCNAQACQALTNQKGTDVSIAILPLFHTFGQSLIMNTSILAGSALVLIPRFVPKTVIQQIHEHKVTHLAGVPTMFIGLLAYAEKHPGAYLKEIAQTLKVAISGGASMPVEILKQFEEKLQVPVIEGYGLSESSPVAAFNHLEFERKPGSIGQPLPGVTMKVVDKNGHEVPTGQEGELVIRGHNVMKGYYKKPQETAKTIVDGWLHTGDIVRFDDEGYIYVVDRLKELIISGGYNIYPREVEEVYMKHPSVHLVAVIGVEHPRFGEEVKAFVILKEGHSISEKELIKWSKEQLADYKCPKHLDIVEALPMTATGKILKRMLK